MLNIINTKILIAILAALGVIGALLVHQQHESEKAAVTAAKSAALLQQQQRETAAFAAKVEAEKRKKNAMPANQSKTWRTYVP